jgi:DNA topoisomerase-1
VGEGKFGPYVRCGKAFISIPKGKDPLSLTMDEAVALIEERRQAEQPLHEWGDIQVLRGRYGAYIHTPQGNYQISKGTDAAALTEEKVRQIIASSEPLKPAKQTFRRKSAK